MCIRDRPRDAEKEEVARLFRETGYSRLPVYEETIDSIVGVILSLIHI